MECADLVVGLGKTQFEPRPRQREMARVVGYCCGSPTDRDGDEVGRMVSEGDDLPEGDRLLVNWI